MSDPWDDPERLRQLYAEENLSMAAVGDRLGCSRYVISDRLEAFGIDKPWRDEETLHQLYVEEGLSTIEIADRFDTTHKTINSWLREFGIELRRASQDRPVSLVTDSEGYEKWVVFSGGKQRNVYHHRLLACSEYGISALRTNQVHHENGISWDNRPKNIELLSPEEHGRLHGRES